MNRPHKQYKKIAIIGAGPAGLTAAYSLAKKGYNVDLFEAEESVGGMAKTIELWGQLVDLGPHRFFSNNPRVNNFWLDALVDDYSIVNRLTRIFYRGTFFNYPLKPFNALKGLGILEAAACVLSYGKAKLFSTKKEHSFEDWVSNRFGNRLYSIFFKSYSEKLWGIPCKELDADFAAQRIKKLSLYEAIKNAIIGSCRNKHQTLMDVFAYPHKGAGAVYEALAEKFAKLGGNLHLSTEVDYVSLNSKGDTATLTLQSGKSMTYDHVISTMPINQLVKKMGATQDVLQHAAALTFRNTILVYLQIDGAPPFPDQWIYVHSPNMETGRITNFSNWVPTIKQGCSEVIICLEYWCYNQDPIWNMSEDELVTSATKEAYETSLITSGTIRTGKVYKIPKSYPVYKSDYKEHLIPVERFLTDHKNVVTAIGRYGAFKYNNQDHSILMGLLAAENIADGSMHNLWTINTDCDYQESGKAEEAGMSKA